MSILPLLRALTMGVYTVGPSNRTHIGTGSLMNWSQPTVHHLPILIRHPASLYGPVKALRWPDGWSTLSYGKSQYGRYLAPNQSCFGHCVLITWCGDWPYCWSIGRCVCYD